ncbi:MAG: ThuA domain-containing protein [Bacteroidota bacterium]
MKKILLLLLTIGISCFSAQASLKDKNVLFTYGGWKGHDPEGCLKMIQPWLESEGARVFPYDNLEVYADSALMDSMDLIIQIWTMGKIEKKQLKGLLKAVKSGTGFAGWHGGIGDSFRQQTEYQFMVGGQWVAHPGGKIEKYEVNVVDPQDPIMDGIEDFVVPNTEQYFMLVDPNVHVLASTTFSGEHAYWIDGSTMPVIWKKYFGEGRIFFTSIGHFAKDLENPPVKTTLYHQGVRSQISAHS